jgi:RNA polymerase sigma factor (sigma-70 family)
VEQSDNTARRGGDTAIASTRYPTSARLLSAIHRGDEIAIKELFLLYAPLLRDQARRMGIEPDRRNEFVTTLLDDVVLHFLEYQIAPRHLSRYLVASLRNRARNQHRDSQRSLARHERAYRQLGAAGERVVAECHSAYGLRASDPLDADTMQPLRGPIARLAERSAQQLSPEENAMLICVGRHMPLREIAGQIGVSYGAARVRLHRLRERFRRLAIEHVAALKGSERHELERFFRRAEVSLAREAVRQKEKTDGQI